MGDLLVVTELSIKEQIRDLTLNIATLGTSKDDKILKTKLKFEIKDLKNLQIQEEQKAKQQVKERTQKEKELVKEEETKIKNQLRQEEKQDLLKEVDRIPNHIMSLLFSKDFKSIPQEYRSFPLIYSTANLEIKFDFTCKSFQCFYKDSYIDKYGQEHDIYEFFGTFKDVERLQLTHYSIQSEISITNKFILRIKNIAKSEDEGEDTQDFDLNLNKYIEFGRFIKCTSQKEQNLINTYRDLFLFLKSNSCLGTKKEISTTTYGIFKDDLILLPNTCKLNYNIMGEKNFHEQELDQFENLFDKIMRHNYDDEQENKQIVNDYINYLKSSYRARQTTKYALASLFRQYLMRQKNLKAFYFLALQSIVSGTGKSTINNLCINRLLHNFSSDGYAGEILKGTTQRITGYSFLTTPLVIDDMKAIENSSTNDLLKTTATSCAGVVKKFPNNKATYYFNLRPLCVSVNQFLIRDPNLADRFNILSFDNPKVKALEKLDNDDLIVSLNDNMEFISQKLYDNINPLFDIVRNMKISSARSECVETVFDVGTNLLNAFSKILGSDETFNDDILYFENSRESILTDADLLQQELNTQLKKVSETKYKIKDTGDLKVLNYELLYNEEIEPRYKKLIKDQLNEMSIGFSEDKQENSFSLHISSISLNFLKFSSSKFDKINKFITYFNLTDSTKKINNKTMRCAEIKFYRDCKDKEE